MISETEAKAQAELDITQHPAAEDSGGRILEEVLKEAAHGKTRAAKKKRVGTYLLGKTLGEGAFAKVRVALHLITKEKVAMKIISKKAIKKKSDYWRRNMRREGITLQRLAHPNIVRLYEVMETDNHYYLVTELVDGRDFTQYLKERKVLGEEEACVYMRQVVSAVDHMHRSGVIHRDLKVDNILLGDDMNIKLIDFGLSCNWDGHNLLKTQCGSPAYAAPEIFSRTHYGPGVDIWSIGVNLYTMLTGTLPFLVDQKPNLTRLHAAILKGVKPPSHLSPECQDLLKRLLEPEIDQRITMADLLIHPWLNKDKPPIQTVGIQVPLNASDLDNHVVRFMVKHMSLDEMSLKSAILHHKPSFYFASYYLLVIRKSKGLGYPDVKREFEWLGKTKKRSNKIDSEKIFMAIREFKDGKPEVVHDPIFEEEEGEEGVDANLKSPTQSSSDDKDTEATGSTLMSSEMSTPLHRNSPVAGDPDTRPRSSRSNFSADSGRPITPRTVYKECLKQLKGHKSEKDSKSILKKNKNELRQERDNSPGQPRRRSKSGGSFSDTLPQNDSVLAKQEGSLTTNGNPIPSSSAGRERSASSSLEGERPFLSKLRNDRSVKDMLTTVKSHYLKDKKPNQVSAKTKRLGSDPMIKVQAKNMLQSSLRIQSPPPVPPNSAMGNYRVLPPVYRSHSEEVDPRPSSPKGSNGHINEAGSLSREERVAKSEVPSLTPPSRRLPALTVKKLDATRETLSAVNNHQGLTSLEKAPTQSMDKHKRHRTSSEFQHEAAMATDMHTPSTLGPAKATDQRRPRLSPGKLNPDTFSVPVVGTSPSASPKGEIPPLTQNHQLR